ncbi:MAG: hypothetical protein MUF33_06990 [Candidatus Nanopelagicales bacterium]|jgi:hypothetical protein|nr:hypothetical protein [Candidatus Nanopelagicales bacterium]MCU0298250.1 hypothetical protein [Candidatus Nanopelagicales bacterium]
MRKLIALLVAVLVAAVLTGCGSGSEQRAEPFVGQWESTGGEQIAMTVAAPVAGKYAVNITGENVDLDLSAQESEEMVYKATGTASDWTFRLVDDELLTATVEAADQAAVSTSFKRVGE